MRYVAEERTDEEAVNESQVRVRTTEEVYVYTHHSTREKVFNRLRKAGYAIKNFWVSNDKFDFTVVPGRTIEDRKPVDLGKFLQMKRP